MAGQISLFDDEPKSAVALPLQDGDVTYYANWLSTSLANEYLCRLQTALPWAQDTIFLYGKEMKIPRLQSWHGDEHCAYRYSGKTFLPHPWEPTLQSIREACENEVSSQFNCVLANWYRDGNDGMGLHADDEPELGLNPVIASVTLGAERVFTFKHVHKDEKHQVLLQHGSLLVMAGQTQNYYHHGISKTKKTVSDRINLTFRFIK